MSRLSENRTVRESPSPPCAEFSIEERRILLGVAHEAILSVFTGMAPGAVSSSHLSEPRGVFTTLYLGGDLRGCVGYVMPIAPLYRAVVETARAAAFEDSRFLPVTEEEAPRLEVSLSALSRLFPVQPEQVEVGRHGLVVCLGTRRGLLLPQVPVEYDWDRETFLEQTCRKAGLPLDAWRQGATLEAFTAEVFGDSEMPA
jgi:AmmeMemoRadiSam system protein A